MKKLSTLEQPDMFEPTHFDAVPATAAPKAETEPATAKEPATKQWRHLNLYRDDRTHYIPGIGFADRDSYESIVNGGSSSPFLRD